jgi:hypothetical protein
MMSDHFKQTYPEHVAEIHQIFNLFNLRNLLIIS